MTLIKRWIQRYNNYCKALTQLGEAVDLINTRDLSQLEKQGMIQGFEFTHELAWKVMKDFFNDRGNSEIFGSKDATREAFQFNIIKNGELWMRMIQSRNLSSHTYDEEIADKIIKQIIEDYYKEFIEFKNSMSKYIGD